MTIGVVTPCVDVHDIFVGSNVDIFMQKWCSHLDYMMFMGISCMDKQHHVRSPLLSLVLVPSLESSLSSWYLDFHVIFFPWDELRFFPLHLHATKILARKYWWPENDELRKWYIHIDFGKIEWEYGLLYFTKWRKFLAQRIWKVARNLIFRVGERGNYHILLPLSPNDCPKFWIFGFQNDCSIYSPN